MGQIITCIWHLTQGDDICDNGEAEVISGPLPPPISALRANFQLTVIYNIPRHWPRRQWTAVSWNYPRGQANPFKPRHKAGAFSHLKSPYLGL